MILASDNEQWCGEKKLEDKGCLKVKVIHGGLNHFKNIYIPKKENLSVLIR